MQMLEGVQTFQDIELDREETPHRVIWSKANARLLDYGGNRDAAAILCIPSLINRYHILDLYPERSFVRYLTEQGVRVLMLDWDEPGLREKNYDCADYVDYLLLDALRSIRIQHRGPLHLLGYCMGGIFALAAAQLRPHDVDGLILLATPWQFDAPPMVKEDDWETFASHIAQQDTIPPLWTQTLFHLLDPWHFQDKFARFNDMSDEEQYHFAAVERWVNDGVPLARNVARDCYINWPRDNTLANGQWRVSGQMISPESIPCPSLVVAPSHDRIVPLASAKPLANLIPNAQCLMPKTGHVSMVVGKQAQQNLWKPLLRWVES